MKVLPHRRHACVVSRRPIGAIAWVQVGALATGIAVSGCVLREEVSAMDEGASSGSGAAADPGELSGGSTGPVGGATSGGSSAGFGSTDRAPDGASTEGSSGGDDMLPDPSTGTSTGIGSTVFAGDCCSPHRDAGCDDPEVSDCVCAVDSFCCEEEWDEVCVDLMNDLGCMTCPSTKLPPQTGSCCDATYGRGCLDAGVNDCVCAIDPFCCQVQWDETCVSLVEARSCGQCLQEPCCAATPQPGCPADLGIEACVCAEDPFCCDTEWDGVCVSGVHGYGCGDCVYVSQGGDCCSANGSPGCDDPEIEACVCMGDPFCCQTSWDMLCADEVDSYGYDVCPVSDTGTGGDSGGLDTGMAVTTGAGSGTG